MQSDRTQYGQYILTPDHMAVFGSIIQSFARHEYLIQAIIGSLLKIPLASASLIIAGLAYAGKRNAILSLLRAVEIEEEMRGRIRWFLGELHKRNQLRNHIAHSLWIPGVREHSIKPFGADPRGGNAKFVGLDPGEPDYLLAELIDIADELSDNYDRFVDYLNEVKLLTPPIIASKIEQSSSPTSSSEGTPSAK